MKRLRSSIEKVKDFFALERNIQILIFSSVIGTTGALLWSPFLSLYLKALGASMEQLGFVFTIRQATMVLMGVVSGVLADKIGRKPCIIMGNTLGATMYIFLGLATRWEHLIVPLILEGFAGSLIGPGMWAMIAESIPEKKRATAFATITVFTCVPPLIGPAIGGYVIEVYGYGISGYGILCLAGGVLMYMTALIRWNYLKETRKLKMAESSTPHKISLDALKGTITHFTAPYRNSRSLKAFLAISLLGSFAWSIAGNYFVVFMEDIIGLRGSEMGIIFSLSSFAHMFMTIPAGKLADKFGRRPCILFSYLASFPLSIIFLFTRNFTQAAPCFLASAVVGTIGGPAWSALLAEITPDEQRATITGTLNTLQYASSSIGPTIGGYLWENYSPRMPFYVDILIDFPSIIIFALYVKPSVTEKPKPERPDAENQDDPSNEDISKNKP